MIEHRWLTLRLHSCGPYVAHLLRVFVCVAARVLVTLFFGGFGGVGSLLVSLCGAGFVPGAIDSLEPFYLLLSVSPDVLLCYLLADLVSSDLKFDGAYALPRLGARQGWALRRFLALGGLVLAYVVVSFASSALLVCATRLAPVNFEMLVIVALQCLVISFLALYVLVLGINLLSFAHDAVVSFVLVVGLHLGVLLGLRYAPSGFSQAVVRWVPSARALPAWHATILSSLELDGAGALMSPLVTVLIFVTMLLTELLVLRRMVRRVDVL